MKRKLLCKKVNSKTFGDGIIVWFKDNLVYCDFNGEIKKFAIFIAGNSVLDFITFINKEDELIMKEIIEKVKNGEYAGDDCRCLMVGDRFGTKAIDVYDECCDELGWDKRFRGGFLPRTCLYASDATSEGYGVWMIAHDSSKGTNGGEWINDIFDNNTIIKEFWEDTSDRRFLQDKTTRVIFWKRDTCYEFLGIFELVDIDFNTQKKTYKLISRTYPETK